LLFPIQWEEPFGLVMIEAMACGTPVLAFGEGSVPEVIDDGLSGIIVHSVPEAVAAYPELVALDRREVRRVFDERFTVRRMAEDYVSLYRGLLAKGADGKRSPRGAGAGPFVRVAHTRED
jgi:glycosyltransferase involved in cell wall biosynthesis